jgi:acyl carrier protein
MKENEAFDRVRKVVAAILNLNQDKVTMEALFARDLGADCIDIVELRHAVAEEFGIEIPKLDDDAESIGQGSDGERIKTVAGAVKYIVEVL